MPRQPISESLLNFSFRITDDDRQSAVNNLVNWNKWQQENLFKEGAPDAREYTNLMFLKDNLNTILKTTFKEAFSKGQKSLVENEDNITLGFCDENTYITSDRDIHNGIAPRKTAV